MRKVAVALLLILFPVLALSEEEVTCEQYLEMFRKDVQNFQESHYDARYSSDMAFHYSMGIGECPDHPSFYVVYAESICFGDKAVIRKRIEKKEAEMSETDKKKHKEYLELAACYLHRSLADTVRAAEAIRKAEKLKPESPAISFFKADIALNENKLNEAETFMNSYMKKGPACLEATRLNNLIQTRLGKGPNQKERDAQRLKRSNAEERRKAGRGQGADALNATEKVSGEGADDLMAQAKAAEAAGDYAKAVHFAQDACKKDPSNMQNRLYLRDVVSKYRSMRKR